MNEKYILNIIEYGLEGNTAAVSGWAGKLESDIRREGHTILADRIKEKLVKPRPLSSFNEGWWNAFSSFSQELLDRHPGGPDYCLSILKGAGITAKEAQIWLASEECKTRKETAEVVKEYINTLI